MDLEENFLDYLEAHVNYPSDIFATTSVTDMIINKLLMTYMVGL